GQRHWHRSAGDDADLADGSRRRARGLYSIQRRGRGSSRGNYQPVSLDSHHLARIEGWSGRLTRTTWSARTRAAHRSRFVDARRYYRMLGDHRGRHGRAAITPARFLIVLFGFLFVTVSSRLTGEIGSSSNPISGMTVATL